MAYNKTYKSELLCFRHYHKDQESSKFKSTVSDLAINISRSPRLHNTDHLKTQTISSAGEIRGHNTHEWSLAAADIRLTAIYKSSSYKHVKATDFPVKNSETLPIKDSSAQGNKTDQ